MLVRLILVLVCYWTCRVFCCLFETVPTSKTQIHWITTAKINCSAFQKLPALVFNPPPAPIFVFGKWLKRKTCCGLVPPPQISFKNFAWFWPQYPTSTSICTWLTIEFSAFCPWHQLSRFINESLFYLLAFLPVRFWNLIFTPQSTENKCSPL